MSVSAIIPTKNRATDLIETLHTLFRQSVNPSELIIVDQSPSDESRLAVHGVFNGLADALRSRIQLIYIHDPAISGLAVARNRAIDRASGQLWLFLDDDVLLEPDFIEQVVTAYNQDKQLSGVAGIITNYRPGSLS